MIFNYEGKDYELKYSFRAMMIYENITKKSFNPKTITDIIVFFYSILVSSGKGDSFEFDNFMEILDSQPEKLTEFSEWLTNIFTMNQQLSPVDTEVEEELKKIKKEAEKAEEKN